jgi:acyl-coenzyme A thioesterase PaaI-like protein
MGADMADGPFRAKSGNRDAARFGARLRGLIHHGQGEAWATLELKLNFAGPIGNDTAWLRAEGRTIHHGRTRRDSESDVRDGTGEPYMHASPPSMIFPVKG